MPRRIGDFELEHPVGAGGMAEVWSAVHGPTQRTVALKLMRGDQVGKPGYREVFADEVRAVAGLDHPGIIKVYDHGVDEGSGAPYFAMELGQGTLQQVQAGSLHFDWQRRILLRLLDALRSSRQQLPRWGERKTLGQLAAEVHGGLE